LPLLDNLPSQKPDAHGEAALLLTESLLHGLIARAILPVAEAIEMVEIAIDAKLQIDDDGAQFARGSQDALRLLAEIKLSLELDVPSPLNIDPQTIVPKD